MTVRYVALVFLTMTWAYPSSSAIGQCCVAPTGETAAFTQYFDLDPNHSTIPTEAGFLMVLQGSQNFSGSTVQESDISGWQTENLDSCWWPSNPDNLPQVPSIIALDGGLPGQWTVTPENTYGPDYVGFSQVAIWDIQHEGYPSGKVPSPCNVTVYQQMQLVCGGGSTLYDYQINRLQSLVWSSLGDSFAPCRYTPTSSEQSCGTVQSGPASAY